VVARVAFQEGARVTTGGRGSPALEIDGLRKTFGDTVALYDVNLTVGWGSFFRLGGTGGSDVKMGRFSVRDSTSKPVPERSVGFVWPF
jgi:hypothetical protein